MTWLQKTLQLCKCYEKLFFSSRDIGSYSQERRPFKSTMPKHLDVAVYFVQQRHQQFSFYNAPFGISKNKKSGDHMNEKTDEQQYFLKTCQKFSGQKTG